MNTKRFWVFGIVLLLCIAGFYCYNNILYKDIRNVEKEESSFLLSSADLINEYKKNASQADLKYLNKTIEIQGQITEFSEGSVTLDSTVFCDFDKKITVANHEKVKIKGRCIGFDEMFNEVKFDQCTILE